MSKERINTFSFNNFKPFGEKMQSFSKKPITLIYGPNSIGKSSLLHSMLYYEYLDNLSGQERQDTQMLDLTSDNFAGDELAFGGFNNFINMHDPKKHINYSYTINKEKDLELFFPSSYKKIKRFEEDDVFEFIENIRTTDDSIVETVKNRFKNYQVKDSYFILSSGVKSHIHSRPADRNQFLELFIEYNNLQNNVKSKEIFENCLKSDEIYENIIYRKDGKVLDSLDKYLLFILDMLLNKPIFNNIVEIESIDEEFCEIILGYVDFYRYIANIKCITLSTSVGYSEKSNGLILKNNLKIDNDTVNDTVLNVDYTGSFLNPKQSIQVNGGNIFIQTCISYLIYAKAEMPFDKRINDNIKMELSLNMWDKDNNFDFIYGRFVAKYFDTTTKLIKSIVAKSFFRKPLDLQYIGPLRYLPSRYDYLQMVKNNKSNKKMDKSYNFKYEMTNIITKYNNFTYKINSKFLRNIFENNYMRVLIAMPFFLPLIVKTMKSQMSNSILTMKARNLFRSNRNKLSLSDAKTSERMWRDLLSSEELQTKVNHWLSNEKKLKTPYRIVPIEYEKELSFFQKIFSRKKDKDSVEIIPEFVDIKKDITVSIKSMGLGISQVLPVIISSVAIRNTKIFLEQPELHLHPAVQAELADEFIRSYKENNNEFMIETHSEHLLLRIMKRMRHTAEGRMDKDDVLALTPDDVCLLYVDSDGKNTFVNELELDEDGTLLDPWPNGFFEEGHRERFD